jgi:hypothetical protein
MIPPRQACKCRSIAEIAEAEKINRSFVSRLLDLTLLAPDIQEAILEGRQAKGMQLEELTRAMPEEWGRQRERIACLLIEPAIQCSGEVPATRSEMLKVHPQKAASIHCKMKNCLFVDRCQPSCRSHRR